MAGLVVFIENKRMIIFPKKVCKAMLKIEKIHVLLLIEISLPFLPLLCFFLKKYRSGLIFNFIVGNFVCHIPVFLVYH